MRRQYEAYWAQHCLDGSATSDPLGFGRRCRLPDLGNPPRIPHVRGAEFVYRVVGAPELWLKLAKDACVLALLVAGLVKLRSPLSAQRLVWWAWPLVVVVAISALRVVGQGDIPVMAAALRGWVAVMVAVACGRIVSAGFMRGMAVPWAPLLLVELLLAVHEFAVGLPVNGYLPFLHLPRRMAGSFVKPNALGVAAVGCLAFAVAFDENPRRRALGLAACVSLVLVSGSATGLVLLVLWAATSLLRRAPGHLKMFLFAACVGAALLAAPRLPQVLGRDTVFQGLTPRVAALRATLERPGAYRLLFGDGIGHGTNALANLTLGATGGSGDSVPVSLLRQMGLLGAAAFYLALVAAWRSDPAARVFLEAVALSSLTTSVLELFPLNVLLGLVLARSIWQTAPARIEGLHA